MTYLIIFIPFFLFIFLNLLPGRYREPLAFYLTLILLTSQVLIGTILFFNLRETEFLSALEPLLKFNLHLYKLGTLLLLLAGVAGTVSLWVNRCLESETNLRFNFANLLLLALIGMNGITMVTDLFSLYLFIEITAIASFILITLRKDRAAFEGVLKYLILSVIATACMLASIAFFTLESSGTSFAAVKFTILLNPTNPFPKVALILFISGLLIKGGLVPFHGWVMDAYSAAPGAVSILLAGIITKASGIYGLFRILITAGLMTPQIKTVLFLIGILSIIVGALAALWQKDLKRMLAYSSISQTGYIILGLAVSTPLAIGAALIHFFNHAILKSQLFVNAATIEKQTGNRTLNNLGGLSAKLPATAVTTTIAALSLAGIPPLSGFWSKIIIIVAVWTAGYPTYSILALLSSILTLAYFLYFLRKTFFGTTNPNLVEVKEANFSLLLPAYVLSAVTLVIGIIFPLIAGAFAW
jgi:multicomponent Na+:H+ antiporter subunit D